MVVPNTYEEAVILPQAPEWRKEMDRELASLKHHNVYGLVPMTSVPKGH